MVRWYHAIFSAYGFWLPNDPRGSWSDFVHSYELYRFGGPATTVGGKRSYAHDLHDMNLRREAKEHLKYPPTRFDNRHRESIAKGIARACEESEITVYACAIGFDHIHIVTARHHEKSIEDVVKHFKSRATQQMNAEGCHPMARYASGSVIPTPWGVGLWSVFIDDVTQLRNAIRYVTRHPEKEGLVPQAWSFVKSI
jgi:REP element-mobilizing transposase RayT